MTKLKPLTDPAAIEAKAKELWAERERSIRELWGIKSMPWDEAPEKGRELMRQHARIGKQSWLDETKEEKKRRLRAKNFDGHAALLGLFQHVDLDREALAHVTNQYIRRWFDDWLHQRRALDAETWMRDIAILALAFGVIHEFNVDSTTACRLTAEGISKSKKRIKPRVNQEYVEKLMREHKALMDLWLEIASAAAD